MRKRDAFTQRLGWFGGWGGPLGGRSTNASIPAAVTLPDFGAAVLRLQVALLAYLDWGPAHEPALHRVSLAHSAQHAARDG